MSARSGRVKFDELDTKMRLYETAHDYRVLPGLQIVVRLAGRGLTRLTREVHQFERPFDPRFRDLMVATTEHLMGCGFRMVYGYCQSDEISLLFHPEEASFGRKARKLLSILAGEASAKVSLLLGDHASFDCRLSQLPDVELVVDYFRWRSEDAHRNALNGHCYWTLRDDGLSVREATAAVVGLSVARKAEVALLLGGRDECPIHRRVVCHGGIVTPQAAHLVHHGLRVGQERLDLPPHRSIEDGRADGEMSLT